MSDALELVGGILDLISALVRSAERARERRELAEWSRANGYRCLHRPNAEMAARARALMRHCLAAGARNVETMLTRGRILIVESSAQTDTRIVADWPIAGALLDLALPDKGWREVVRGEPAQMRVVPWGLQLVAQGRLTPYVAGNITRWLEDRAAQLFSSQPFR